MGKELVKEEKSIIVEGKSLKERLNCIDVLVVLNWGKKYAEGMMGKYIGMWYKGREIAGEYGGANSPSYREIERQTGRDHKSLKKWHELYIEYKDDLERFKQEYALPRVAKDLLAWEDGLKRLYSKTEILPLPPGKFRVFYADPPWQFDNAGFKQSAESKYLTMPTDEIIKKTDSEGKTIPEKTYEDSVLFLWATNAMLEDALRVMEEWGFKYKSNMVWCKDRSPGMGWFVDSRHELLLIGTKEENVHPKFKPISWFEAPVQKHSQKPEIEEEIIEKMYKGPYVDLFARENKGRKNWTYWGNEINDK